jgi:hypothetical protein
MRHGDLKYTEREAHAICARLIREALSHDGLSPESRQHYMASLAKHEAEAV